MRTKTLLIAAAAMAAGVVSSIAQVTYSQNIVGYATVVLAGNGQYTLVANPFDDGNGNQATNLLNNALPKGSQFITWDPILTYTTVQKVGSPVAGTNWPAGTTTALPAGTGFFVRNGPPGANFPAVTNVFVGSVIANVGSSVTNPVPLGYSLQGSPIPYGGNIAIVGQGGGDTNMDFGTPLTKGSQILTWDPVLTFATIQKLAATSLWNGTATVGVGQGFFIFNKNGPVTNVIETLNP